MNPPDFGINHKIEREKGLIYRTVITSEGDHILGFRDVTLDEFQIGDFVRLLCHATRYDTSRKVFKIENLYTYGHNFTLTSDFDDQREGYYTIVRIFEHCGYPFVKLRMGRDQHFFDMMMTFIIPAAALYYRPEPDKKFNFSFRPRNLFNPRKD